MSLPPRGNRAPSARTLAWRILTRVEQDDAWASPLLDYHRGRFADPRDAALARELVQGVLRRRAALDHALASASSRPLGRIDPAVLTALRIGAYEILFLDRVPDFAAVDTTVELVKRRGPRAAAGFANAVLRKVVAVGRDGLPTSPARGDVLALALYHSHPRWWVERVVSRLGWEAAAALLAANNEPAATVVRSNRAGTDATELARRLAGEGVLTEPCRFVADALRVIEGAPAATQAFKDGHASIQDEASQLIPLLLGRGLGPRVADLCAAPGGKTLQLAGALASGGWILACDRRAERLARMRDNLRRVGAQDAVSLVAADLGAERIPVRGEFDQVLVDAPCSGTGTLRRHPEIRWRLRRGDITRLARLQAKILHNAAGLVARGGSLVYAVCSIEPEEGPRVAERFLAENTGFEASDPREDLPPAAASLLDERGALATSPATDGLDGFFGMRFERR